MKNGYSRRNLKERSDKSFLDDLESEEFKNTHRELYNKYGACLEYDTCHIYSKICQAGLDDSLTQYFECTQVQKQNGQIAYVGPHCAADGITITLGIYSDEDCNNYIGNGLNIANFIGFALEGDELSPYVTGSLIDIIPEDAIKSQKSMYSTLYASTENYTPVDNMCIPCMAARQSYENLGYVGDYADQDVYDTEISEICTNLYLLSARCDKHYRNYKSKTSSKAYAQAVLEENMSCDFIDSVVMGNYDESGFANINTMKDYTTEENSNMFSSNLMWEQYGSNVQDVSGGQVWGLTLSILACVGLAGWAASLTKSLNKGTSWRPRRWANLAKGQDAVTMERGVSSYKEPEPPVDLSDRHNSYYMS